MMKEVIKYEEKDLIDKETEIIESILSRSLFQKNYFNQKIYWQAVKNHWIISWKEFRGHKIILDSENLEKDLS